MSCGTCAFRVGCATHDSEAGNRLRSMICADAGLPFYCHYADGNDYSKLRGTMTVDEQNQLRNVLPICQGWKARVKELAARGHYRPEVRSIRRRLGVYAIQLLDKFLSGEGDKDEVQKELGQAIQLLKASR